MNVRASLAAFAWRATPEVTDRIARELRKLESWDGSDMALLAVALPDPQVRSEAVRLFEAARSAQTTPRDLGYLLDGAAVAVAAHRDSERIELVWSGPVLPDGRVRRTSEALLEVAREARQVLTLVTFAAYRVPEVRIAIEEALQRGVAVRFVAETEDASGGRLRFDAVEALGSTLGRGVQVYTWPLDRRPVDARGGRGTLHAKFALADDRALFVTSANLTEYALESNIEMGVLLTGGELPKLAARHIDKLVHEGVLRTVAK